MYHITFLAPYPDCIPLIEQVFRERPDREQIEYEIVPDYYNNQLDQVHGEVIISRGFTAHTMQRLQILGAELIASGYDVVRAVMSCIQQYPDVPAAVIAATNLLYDSEVLSQLYTNVRIYPIQDETHLEETLLQALRDGAGAIVGGSSTCDIARRHQVPAVLIESGRKSIDAAISNAINIVDVSRYEKQKNETTANLLNYSFQGVIMANRSGIIEVANRYALEHLNQKKGPLKGRNLQEFFPDLPYDALVRGERTVLTSELYRSNGKTFLCNCAPVEVAGQVTSCVLTFQTIEKVLEEEHEIRRMIHKTGFVAKYTFSDILHHGGLQETIQQAKKLSEVDSNILIRGESGTGKELFAQSIHNASSRKNRPFVAINCAALPDNILESELFGYVEGAFTGAAKGGKAGFFEIAHRGTLFLDEIGDISTKLQSRLLRVLQEREIIRLGSSAVTPIDVRIIAATNKDLREEVRRGTFREDLYYRLNVLELKLPPIRQRRRDIPCLIQHFLDLEWEKHVCTIQGFTPDAMKRLESYDWPGNIRELRNFCERVSILCQVKIAGQKEVLQALPDCAEQGIEPSDTAPSIEQEREQLRQELLRHQGNRKETAKALGIHPSTLWRRMKRLGLE